MSRTLSIALLQLLPAAHTDATDAASLVAAQRERGIAACRQAHGLGADIALFPEMWSCGYTIPRDMERLKALALPSDGEFVRSFGRLAGELGMAVGITYLEKTPALPRNSLALFDRHGARVLDYAKVHTCGFADEARLCAGDGFGVCDLDTGCGTVRIGAMICFDREFPESARILMLEGAEVILAPNACPMEVNRLAALRTRAYENMLAVATCNYPAPHPDCNGHSTVFDGVPWLCDESGSRDMCVLEAPESEGVYLARMDLGLLRAHRAHDVMGNAWRRPQKYAALTEEL